MAVTKISGMSRMVLGFEVGMDEFGRPVVRSQTLQNVRPDADDQDVYDVAQALASLQAYPLSHVVRVDQAQLTE
ncbi:MAG: hypothetical protein BAA01_10475 [Bacillus thermozeamaize]|mgnify:CR=1 FL=1|uniref:DUF1659 domain-containing protein n=1 Tax=Bacillus thermozeamaize TaxID=230954 RepID=A0A1Y3PDT9_9BACI|nr:MAG: hypothetical protein BAA01_10475 [Bacillus thermozeamaize]